MGINRKSGQNSKKSGTCARSGAVGWPAVPDSDERSKSQLCKNLASLNLESGTTFLLKKVKKGENRITAINQYYLLSVLVGGINTVPSF